LIAASGPLGTAVDSNWHQNERLNITLFMAIPLLICDDSNMARKQVTRSLPDGWDVDITYATNGVEGVQAIKDGKGEWCF